MAAQPKNSGSDGRLATKQSDDSSSRGSRDLADAERVERDGTALSMAERRALLREQLNQEILPTPPDVPGWHFCWLSTTNNADPIYKRIRLGYEPVKASELPGFSTQHQINGGEFDGCICCNEMILFKIPDELFQEIMLINHHEKPLEEEAMLREGVVTKSEKDSREKELVSFEGFENLGRAPKRPTF